jgi:4-amino-4-deoxy-L-arabinose transferase-like glycosyltransferase
VSPRIRGWLRRHGAICLAVWLLALTPRLLFLAELRRAPTFDAPEGGDSIFYDRVASGERDDKRAYFHSPLYDGFISASYRVFGRDFVALRVIQHLLGAASALLVYWLAWRLFRRRGLAALAGSLQALFGPGLFYEGQLLPDALLPFLVAATALAVLHHDRRRSLSSGLGLGVAVGVASLARPTTLIWLPALLVWAIVTRRGAPRRRWTAEALVFVGALLVIAPVTARNYLAERDVVWITANEGLNLYIGNNPNARGTYNLPEGMWFRPGDPFDDFSGIKAATRALGHTPSSSELSRWWRQRALGWVRGNPGRAAELALIKLGLWVNSYEYPQLYNYYGYQRICPTLRVLIPAGVIIAPALVGMLAMLWQVRRRQPRLHALCAVLFAAGFVPFFVADRYRVAWIVLVAPFAAWTMAELVRVVRRRLLLDLWRVVVALVCAVMLCFWPLAERPTLAAQFYAFGNAAEARGDLQQAVRWFRETIAQEATWGAVPARLGQALLRLGHVTEAAAVLAEGQRLLPRSAEVQLALGALYRRRGDLQRAERALLTATRLAPALADAWLGLAEVKAERGEVTAAIDAYRSALAIGAPTAAWVESARARLRQLEQRRAPTR